MQIGRHLRTSRDSSMIGRVHCARAQELQVDRAEAWIVGGHADAGRCRTFFLGGVDVEKTLPNSGTLQTCLGHQPGRDHRQRKCLQPRRIQVTMATPINDVCHSRCRSARPSFGPLSERFSRLLQSIRRHGHARFAPRRSPGRNETATKISSPSGFTTERNQTENVDNSRLTFSAGWDQTIHERVRLHFGFRSSFAH